MTNNTAGDRPRLRYPQIQTTRARAQPSRFNCSDDGHVKYFCGEYYDDYRCWVFKPGQATPRCKKSTKTKGTRRNHAVRLPKSVAAPAVLRRVAAVRRFRPFSAAPLPCASIPSFSAAAEPEVAARVAAVPAASSSAPRRRRPRSSSPPASPALLPVPDAPRCSPFAVTCLGPPPAGTFGFPIFTSTTSGISTSMEERLFSRASAGAKNIFFSSSIISYAVCFSNPL
ncbi:uncharacterized protein LOC125537297 [Triticum urartu]|uniref:uncharacterized protein LOC125537296 n=1 Tax=Triticum urartu TaxID=4572 RepID=UPI00204464C8|nr:uncharacterized protein LOC125537296 [Triticum urartu]XP_048556548.1 uncharacterized protein LOC125537297 [Triticum urartu]